MFYRAIQSHKENLIKLYKTSIYTYPFNYDFEIEATIASLQASKGISIPPPLLKDRTDWWEKICLKSNQRFRELEGWEEDAAEDFFTQLFVYLQDLEEKDSENKLIFLTKSLRATYQLRMAFILTNNFLDKLLNLERKKAHLKHEDYQEMLNKQIYQALRMISKEYEPLKICPVEHIRDTARELEVQLFAIRQWVQPTEVKQANNFIVRRENQASQRYTEQHDQVRRAAMGNFYQNLRRLVDTYDPTSPSYTLEGLSQTVKVQKIKTELQQLAYQFQSQTQINLPRREYDTTLKNIAVALTGAGLIAHAISIFSGHGLFYQPETHASQVVQNDAQVPTNDITSLLVKQR